MKIFSFAIAFTLATFSLQAENDYRLWLRYDKIDDAELLSAYQHSINRINFRGSNPTLQLQKKNY